MLMQEDNWKPTLAGALGTGRYSAAFPDLSRVS